MAKKRLKYSSMSFFLNHWYDGGFLCDESFSNNVFYLKRSASGGGSYRVRVKGDVPWRRCWRGAYKTVCAAFTLSFTEVFLVSPVSSCIRARTPACSGSTARVSWSLLTAPRCTHLALLLPVSQALSAAFPRATSPVARFSRRSVRFRRTLGRAAPAAAPSAFWGSPESLRFTLEVCEREVRKRDRVLFVNIGGEEYGGYAPRAFPRAWHRSLVYEVDDLVPAETQQFILIALPATDHAGQVPEGVHAVLRSPPLAVRVMVIVALLVVGDQAAPAPLAARQGGAVMGTHYHVLGGAPSLQVWGDPVAGPHVCFVVGVSSCRGHLEERHRTETSGDKELWLKFNYRKKLHRMINRLMLCWLTCSW